MHKRSNGTRMSCVITNIIRKYKERRRFILKKSENGDRLNKRKKERKKTKNFRY